MALGTAIGCGAVAALAIPYLVRDQNGQLVDLLAGRLVHIPVGGGMELHWSWLVFSVVTLFAWVLLLAARDR